MTEVDAGVTSMSPDAAPSPVARTCKFPASSLRLCIEFEDRAFSPKVTDASLAQLDAPSANVIEAKRGSTYAAALGVASHIDVPESPMLDLTALTIEMSLWPGFAQSADLVVNYGQYYMRLSGDGRVGCILPNAQLWSSNEAAEALTWTHVACTFDGTTLRVYIDGELDKQTLVIGSGLNGNGMLGTRIGGPYSGAIDDIRIYATALSANELCTHAGRTDCGGAGSGNSI